jgi:Na+-transporting NADH:ubiquinone oxidoreductase subunit NqrB
MQSLKLPFALPRSLTKFFDASNSLFTSPFKDARDYQILFLSVFLLLGVSTRDWSLKPIAIAITFATCWLTQVCMISIFASPSQPEKERWTSLKSATITGLGLSLLLRSDSYGAIACAAFLAIASKFIFRTNGKHWFNPANFGIVMVLLLDQYIWNNHAWVSNGQWGEDSLYALVFLGLGGIVLKKVGRWDTSFMFLAAYSILEGLRNLWLGWTWDVLAHRLTSGSLLLFALFMITDPRSIPNAKNARLIWAVAIAVLAFIFRNVFFNSDAMFYALFLISPLTVLGDRLWKAPRFQWLPKRYSLMPMRVLSAVIACLVMFSYSPAAFAFCGFYVSQADASLFNKASQVAIARDGKRTVLTMANDYQGNVKDFALVVPVPVLLKKEQVRVGEQKILDRLDSFSAPRLVEYFDSNPCARYRGDNGIVQGNNNMVRSSAAPALESRVRRDYQVTIEAKFAVGEYDILILSAKDSDGLESWLIDNDYKIPQGAKALLQPYIRQNMKFFVAKVNIAELSKSGSQSLRPLMMAFESPKFMLPIRLGMLNANGDQDLLVYILSPKGQAEVANYRTIKVPSGSDIPVYVKNEFGDFYKSMFKTSYEKEGKKVAFLEYAWDMSSCDPCSAEPLSNDELRKAGVFWLDSPNNSGIMPSSRRRPAFAPNNGRVFITRLHVRYNRDKFPEDLTFKETSNQESFQGRYVLRYPFKGETTCAAGQEYQRSLRPRFEKEAQTLAKLTSWDIADIRRKMNISVLPDSTEVPFWENLWK